MKEARNYKFLNKQPLILGFEFADCIYAVSASIILFAIFKSHLFSLVVGFFTVVSKSFYRKFYPKNSIYFLKNKKEIINSKFSFGMWRNKWNLKVYQ